MHTGFEFYLKLSLCVYFNSRITLGGNKGIVSYSTISLSLKMEGNILLLKIECPVEEEP